MRADAPALYGDVADSRKLTRALENRFTMQAVTPPDGRLFSPWEWDQNFALICVKDTGCGIPETEIPKVSTSYTRPAKMRAGRDLGFPLPAPLCWSMGRISVESVVGGGSTFVIRLPLICEDKKALYKHYKTNGYFDSILNVCQLDLERSQSGCSRERFDKMPYLSITLQWKAADKLIVCHNPASLRILIDINGLSRPRHYPGHCVGTSL